MRTGELGLRFGIAGAVTGVADYASACAICTSNLSYNWARFSAIWFGIFILWLVVLWIWRWIQRANHNVAPAFKPYVWAFSRYAIVLVVLFVILGAHLSAVLFFPLVIVIQWVKRSSTIKAGDERLWMHLKYANVILIAALLLAVPLGQFLPPVISEVETRQRQQDVINNMRKVLDTEDRNTAAAHAVDPYNYDTFDVPVYNLLMQGMLFYRPRENAGFKVADANGKTIVFSRGPNGKFDLSPEIISKAIGETSDTANLAPYTYDATNGMVGTSGDIWVAR